MGQIVFQATLGGQVAVAGPNTASSFTLTLPAATDTLVGKATTDTLTNKTLTSPTITGATLTTSAFNGTVGATTPSTAVVTSLTDSGLTSGRVTYAGASGLLSDSASLTFDGNALTTPRLALGGTTLPAAGTATLFSRTSDNNTYLQTGSGNNFNLLDGSQNTMISFAPTLLSFAISNSEKMRIDSSGNVGIGTSSPSSFNSNARNLVVGTGSGDQGMSVYGSATGNYFFAKGTAGSDASVGSIRYSFSTDAMSFNVAGGSEKMRIDSSGNLLVGTTSSIGGKLQVLFDGTSGDGIGLKTNNATLDAVFIRFLNSAGSTAGNIYQNGTTSVSYATSSDYRLKENIVPMTGALAKVAQLKPVTYKWKSDGSDGQGFIAHELQEVVPDCVGGKKDAIDADGKPVYQGIDTSFLVATLTKAIQEQQALIESLTTRLTALENK